MFKFTIIDCHRQLSSKIINLFHEANKEISKLLTTQYVYDVSIVNDDEIRAINYRYRKIDKPTDVLSFAFHDNQGIKPILLGEIFINFQQVKWQAQDTYEQEITLLFIHGVLHLLGYNHDNLKKAKLMQNLQNNILKQLNFVA